MSFRLGPDGKPVEVDSSFDERKQRTKPPQNEPATQPPPGRSDAGKTQPPGVDLFGHIEGGQQGNMRPGRMPVSEEPPTRPMRRAKAEIADEPDSNFNAAEPKTQINFGSAGVSGEGFVCGWLVIVDGPGKGKSLTIGAGQSAISRSSGERLTLDFGDQTITSKQQLLVIYDDENREFLISPGNGSSLNRLNGKVVGSQMVLNAGDLLKVGATTLRFVPFCDSTFTWE